MFYDCNFLGIISQLAVSKTAHICIGGKEILVEACPQKKRWFFSTSLYQATAFLSEEVQDKIASANLLKWEEKISFSFDAILESVHLTQEVLPIASKAEFELRLSQFLDILEEWEEILKQQPSLVKNR